MYFIKTYVLLLLLCGNSLLCAQPTSEASVQHLIKGYQLAAEMEDYEAAKIQLIQLLALTPRQPYFAALLKLCYQNGDYNQCVKLAQKFKTYNFEDNASTEILAYSNKQLGFNSLALYHFEMLYQNTSEVLYLYEMAQVQLLLNQLEAFTQSIEKITSSKAAESKTVSISFTGRDGEIVRQQVPVKAAAFNLKGHALLNQRNRKESKQYFIKALEIAPDFTLANGNLASTKFSLF
ncbi:MAG: hypothetical protein WD077_04275 [Bacteroidia bacterium]